MSCVESPEVSEKMHPLAVTSLILALLGIPLFGLLLGLIAAVLAGVAVGQIAANPRFRGKRIALTAIAVGVADMLLWIYVIGVFIPRINHPDIPIIKESVSLSFKAPTDVPAYLRGPMEANVLLFVNRPKRLPFLGTESFSGSGILLGKQGGTSLILTNRHVIDPYFTANDPGATIAPAGITVYFYDGSRASGYVLWVDPGGADLALAATGENPGVFPVHQSTNPRDAEIGDKVFVVGNPHELSWSYAEGIITGIREVTQGGSSLKVLQIQAPINQGNSGGGLYAMDGSLIGIVSWTKNKSQAEGIGFAIRYEDFTSLYFAGRTSPFRPTTPAQPSKGEN